MLRIRIIIYCLIGISSYLFIQFGRPVWQPVYSLIIGAKTVSGIVLKLEPKLKGPLQQEFAKAGASYPPQSISLICLKTER